MGPNMGLEFRVLRFEVWAPMSALRLPREISGTLTGAHRVDNSFLRIPRLRAHTRGHGFNLRFVETTTRSPN